MAGSDPHGISACLSGAGTIDAACMDRQRAGGTGPFGPRPRAHARNDAKSDGSRLAVAAPVRVNPRTPASARRGGCGAETIRG